MCNAVVVETALRPGLQSVSQALWCVSPRSPLCIVVVRVNRVGSGRFVGCVVLCTLWLYGWLGAVYHAGIQLPCHCHAHDPGRWKRRLWLGGINVSPMVYFTSFSFLVFGFLVNSNVLLILCSYTVCVCVLVSGWCIGACSHLH